MFLDIILYGVFPLLSIVSVLEFIIIRGFIKTNAGSGVHKHLTGREIEEIRRKLSLVGGLNAIAKDDVYNLIMTVRDTHLGTYVDEDPYIPADPYEDIEEER